jgi:hypothetical protein
MPAFRSAFVSCSAAVFARAAKKSKRLGSFVKVPLRRSRVKKNQAADAIAPNDIPRMVAGTPAALACESAISDTLKANEVS